MIDKNKLIEVKNRDNGRVGYTIPDLGNLHRTFQPQETKEIPFEELKKLSYLPGGNTILQNYLVINDEEVVKSLLGEVEPEYNYTEKEVEYLLTQGTLDQLMDALDFAPTGVIDLIKDMSVKLELADIHKRKAILEKTGFNVTKAIEINIETSGDEVEPTQSRRAAPVGKSAETTNGEGRKTQPIIIKK